VTVTTVRLGDAEQRAGAGTLRRRLDLLQTAAVSVGVMAPTLAMSITGVAPARLIGRAAPLAYVAAAVGVGLVAYGFVRLSGAFAHAGSVYGFVGAALGPRAGFVAGWALLGTYLVFPAVSISAAAVFGRALLRSAGVADHAPWLPLALVAWALVWLLASRDVRTAARSLLAFEIGSVALILVLMAIVVAKLAGGDGPPGHDVNSDWLRLPPGTTLGTLALASTFGFLSFAGFESAGSLGEESRRPTRMVPRAMTLAILVGGAFYVACTAVQSLGFGTDPDGVRAFAGSEAPLGDLAHRYVGAAMADALDVAAIVSALGAGLGCASVSARMLFALGRDRLLPGRLAAVSSSTGAPAAGLAFVMCLDLVLLLVLAAIGKEAMDVFFYLATIGVLSLLAMYVATNLAALRFLRGRGARAELLLPAAGIAVAGYVLYHNIWPVPDPPFDVFPYLVAGWLVAGAALSALLGRRVSAP
jgi:amino acid transporter